jgi:ribosomal protein L39E
MSSESNNLNTDGLYRHWAQVFQWDEKAKSGRCTICPNENPSLYFSYSEATQNHISSKHSDDCAQGTDFDFGQKPGALFRLHHRLFRCKDCSNVQLPMKASALIEHLQLEIHKNSDIPLWTIEKFVYQVKYSAKRRAQRSTNVLPDTDGQAMKSDALGRAKIEGYFGM